MCVSQRTTTAASQWYHSGIAVVPYCQHPIVKISLSTKITALSKSLQVQNIRCDTVVMQWGYTGNVLVKILVI